MKRLPAILAALAALALPACAQATEPWWSLEAGSRPTNLQPAPEQTEVQEVKGAKDALLSSFAAEVRVGGEPVGCLGAGLVAFVCSEQTEFPPVQTAAQFQEMLEGVPSYAEGEGVEVQGGPVGEAAFRITTPGRWVVPVVLTPLVYEGTFQLGTASVTPLSEGSGRLYLTATNLGDAPLDATATPLRIAEQLPAGFAAYGAEAFAGVQETAGPVDCVLPTTQLLECSFEGVLAPYEAIEVELPVALAPGAADGETGQLSVSGGDGPPKSASQALHVSGEAVRFGIEGFSMGAEEEGGGQSARAGAHPFQLTTALRFNAGRMQIGAGGGRNSSYVEQPAQPRNFHFKLPPGLIGDPSPIPTCSFKQFTTQGQATPALVNECPPETAIGAASVTIDEPGTLKFARVAVPLFNLEPAYGEPARFGFMVVGVPVMIDTELRGPGEAYAIGAKVLDASQLAQVLASTVSIWGNPGDPAHDSARGWSCLYWNKEGLPACRRPAGQGEEAFLRMPVSCEEPLSFGLELEPWNAAPGTEVASAADSQPPLSGCDRLPFDPQISSLPTTRLAANPSGLDFTLKMPDSGLHNPEGLSEAAPRTLEVTLPPGMTANPGAAEGLATCTEAELARESASSGPGAGCPEASKLGTVELETPLLAGRLLKGQVFLATPYENPAGSLLALYLTIREPRAGVLVTQTLEVRPDPATGQIVTVAENIPQLPFSELRMHLREGGRAPLISPPRCGVVSTAASFHPYSVPAPVQRSAEAQILAGPTGGACPQGDPPFEPGFEAGSLSAAAGRYSPFYMRLTRKDGEGDMGRLSFTLPPGVVPKLAGVPYCPEAGIARAQSRQGPHGGREEREDPSCPAASRIGRTIAGAGAGNQLTYAPGSIYLAGPYHGDPISAVAITPALAGPFDAGVVVVRQALRLNPLTHVGEVDGSASDPIPHLLKGIPLSVREIQVYADRPDFTLTPTSCARLQARSSVQGSFLDAAGHAGPESTAALSGPYQAVNCSRLGFRPRLSLRLKGGTRRGAHPALRALVRPRPFRDANFSRAVVTLPHSAFLEQAHIRTICTRVQFAAGPGNGARCPKRSIYGHAKAWSPLLDEPLQGPVFLRSSSHNLPDLVLALHGLVDIDLAARIDSLHGGIRSTFTNIPDAPVSRFLLNMQGGDKGLIVNSRNLCRRPGQNRAVANLWAQNERRRRLRPVVGAAGCAKAKHRRHGHHRR